MNHIDSPYSVYMLGWRDGVARKNMAPRGIHNPDRGHAAAYVAGYQAGYEAILLARLRAEKTLGVVQPWG